MSLMSFEPLRAFRDLDRLSSQLLSGTRVPLAVPMDVWRDDQSYHVALDLPGVAPDGIDLQVERNTLTVTAHREAAYGLEGRREGDDGGDGQHSVLVAERPMGTFTRQLVLGEGLDHEQVQAEYADGVLHVTIPVAQRAQPRRIQVGHGGAGATRTIEGSTSEKGGAFEQGGAAETGGKG
ncbi:MAG: hsp18 [Frankiales bacterium]|nr:hsp18 [Frankiales bacterium]